MCVGNEAACQHMVAARAHVTASQLVTLQTPLPQAGEETNPLPLCLFAVLDTLRSLPPATVFVCRLQHVRFQYPCADMRIVIALEEADQ